MLPPGMTTIQNAEMSGMMGTRRSQPNVIYVNPNHLTDSVLGLTPESARRMIRTTLDEELAELAADSVMTDQGYTELAASLSEQERAALEASYYGTLGLSAAERNARIEADRKSGAWTDADLGREWFRQQTTRLAFGATREETIDRLLDIGDSNPSLLTRILDAIAQYVRELKSLIAVTFTSGTAARIGIVARELRRLQNEGVLPNPEAAPEGEMGDVTAFFNALDGNVMPGQEDRHRFALPVASSNQNKADQVWRKMESYMYDIKVRELKEHIDDRNFTMNGADYIIKRFASFRPLQERALAEGVTNAEIMPVLGTTAPIISLEEGKRIRRELRAFAETLSGLSDAERRNKKEAKERELYDKSAMVFAADFRKQQKAAEDSLRARGFTELVDRAVEMRQLLNKYKMDAGFDSSNDVYLTRTYRYFKSEAWHTATKNGGTFTDPETGKVTDFDALRRVASVEMFEEEVRDDAKKENYTLRPGELEQRAIEKLDEYLIGLDKKAEASFTPDGIAVLQKDLNLLKLKKDIDAPLRELLGEVADPFETAVRTMHNVSRYAANQKFIEAFMLTTKDLGIGTTEPREGYELLFPERRDPEYGSLAGWHVPKEIAVALREEFRIQAKSAETASQGLINGTMRWASKVSGTSILAKTSLGGLGFWTRNILGGNIMTLAQGLSPLTADSLKAANLARLANMNLTENSTEEQRREILRLVELGMALDDTQGRMASDLLKGFANGSQAQLDETVRALVDAEVTGDTNKVADVLKKTFNVVVTGAANLNNTLDTFIKLNAYYQELANIKQNYPDKTQAEAETYAAFKVKKTFPTHSQQLDAVKMFNRSPLALLFMPFLRWKSEVMRTAFNTIPLALTEIKSGNEGDVRRGVRRLVGFTGTLSLGGTVVAGTSAAIFGAIARAFGDDEDDEGTTLTAQQRADYRRTLPAWQRDNDVLLRLVGDQIQSVNLTNIMPYSLFTDYFSLIKEGIVSKRGLDFSALARYTKNQFVGSNILADNIASSLRNENEYGQKIALATDPDYIKPLKLAKHLALGAFAPGMIKKGIQIAGAEGEERMSLIAGEAVGVRTFYTSRQDAVRRGLSSLSNERKEVVALRRPLDSGDKLDTGDIEGVLETHQAALNRNALNVRNFLRTMRELGATDQEIFGEAKEVRMSALLIRQVEAGYSPAWQDADAWVKKTAEAIKRREQDDFSRFPIIRKFNESKPQYYPFPD